ncbi:hypothetical protein KKG29_04260 [Patescibacteria group bacterium]|nr:hypothetical protein [Patescibacteria group bacterium]MBU4000355.1 hypothetical protein [Patescibacteria group bacterium]MBU4369061.1 hypothetical protein [Patescibacteria group bacterium]
MGIETREFNPDEEKEKFREEFLNKETLEAGNLIEEVKKLPISGSLEYKGMYAVKNEEERAETLKELEELRERMKERVNGLIKVFSEFYNSEERDNRLKTNTEELKNIEKMNPTLKRFYKEKPEVGHHLKEVHQENRILGAIKEGKL